MQATALETITKTRNSSAVHSQSAWKLDGCWDHLTAPPHSRTFSLSPAVLRSNANSPTAAPQGFSALSRPKAATSSQRQSRIPIGCAVGRNHVSPWGAAEREDLRAKERSSPLWKTQSASYGDLAHRSQRDALATASKKLQWVTTAMDRSSLPASKLNVRHNVGYSRGSYIIGSTGDRTHKMHSFLQTDA